MRRLLAAALALAMVAPSPAFAGALRAVEPVPTVAMPNAPLTSVALPALNGVPNLPGAALATISNLAVPAAAIPQAAALGAAPQAAAAAALPHAAAPSVQAAAVSGAQISANGRNVARPAAIDTASRIAVAAPDRSAETLDRAYDAAASAPPSDAVVAAEASPSAPRASGLKKWSRTVRAGTILAGVAALFNSTRAMAWPDGMPPQNFHTVANSGPITQPTVSAAHQAAQQAAQHVAQSPTPAWVAIAVVGGFIAAVAGLVWYFRWRDSRRYASSPSIGDDTSAFDGGMVIGTAGNVQTAPGARPKNKDGEEKHPLFIDVAGQDEAKTELAEVVDFLRNPDGYKALHPRYKGPKGVLMFGPPGTGKTLLARAVANEADVPFVHKAGSDFINTYVGTGANNIRKAFEEVRQQIKTKGGAGILFIDEIEAIGGARTGNSDRSEETRTINALLKEMDGFEKDNIIVIAATNMPESLDPALVRGGRFGTKVPVGKPDVVGREKVLDVHLKGAKLAADVDVKALARQTPGLAGADLEQIIMDATKLAKRRGAKAIAQQDLIKAIDEFTTGKQRNLVMSKREKEIVAFHESGHALVSHLLPDADPVRKVTIIPHGLNALGFMQAMPEEEKVLYSYEWLVDRIAVALGGRVAEKMMTGRIYSGAQNDLQQATRLAKLMVMQFGMNDEIGHVSYDVEGERPAVGGPMSEETRKKIDAEVKRIIHDALARVETLLTEHRPALEAMAAELMEKETLRSEDMERIIAASKGAAGEAKAAVDKAAGKPDGKPANDNKLKPGDVSGQ